MDRVDVFQPATAQADPVFSDKIITIEQDQVHARQSSQIELTVEAENDELWRVMNPDAILQFKFRLLFWVRA